MILPEPLFRPGVAQILRQVAVIRPGNANCIPLDVVPQVIAMPTKIHVAPNDTQPIDGFSLAWRWTQDTHAVFEPWELAQIHPLNAEKAREVLEATRPIWESMRQPGENVFPSDWKIVDEFSTKIDEITEGETSSRLSTFGPNPADSVIAIWDRSTAIMTSWELFCRRWDDFCYPSSDDVSIVTLAGDFFAEYQHSEVFTVLRLVV